jgi:hypothetical protein
LENREGSTLEIWEITAEYQHWQREDVENGALTFPPTIQNLNILHTTIPYYDQYTSKPSTIH